MFQFPPSPTPNSFPPDPAPLPSEVFTGQLLEVDPTVERRQEYLSVMAMLAAAELPLLSSETRNRDRHLWLSGLDSVARDILDRADDFEQDLRRGEAE